jgi:predicted dehydrogenase
MKFMSRRTFLGQSGLVSIAAAVASGPTLAQPSTRRWRAAIIGCTGQGDFGHHLDAAFNQIENVQVVAIADPDNAGRERAARRAKAERQYADYRDLLTQERPDLVVVAPRWSDRHFEMAMAALRGGAHVLTEKPFTVTLAEADELLSSAQRAGRRIAVAHQMRLSPSVVHLQRVLADGLVGDLVHLRAWGKQDARAGGEDLIVLGTHAFDMMRLLAGDALACTAQVFTQGREITRSDARPATEKIGLVAGDEIEAQFRFAKGVTASFTSRGRLRETLGPWALELLGTKGALRILMDIDPIVQQRRRGPDPKAPTVVEEWVRLPGDPFWDASPAQRGFGPANRRVVRDWLDAIEHEREPRCSGYNAMKAVEMVMAIYQAALELRPVSIPMTQRTHPLS